MSTQLEEILADVKQEGDTDPFAALSQETETPSDSQTENNEEKDKADQGEDSTETTEDDSTETKEDPFHVRWQQREAKLREELETKFQQDFEAYKESLESRFTQTDDTTDEIPEWFSELYGDNLGVWQKFQAYEQSKAEELKQSFITEQQEKEQQAIAETEYWDKQVLAGYENLEAQGLKFDRNELAKVMLDFRPTDENNMLDFTAGYKLLELQKRSSAPAPNPVRSEARKAIADTSTKTTNGERSKKDYQTTNDLRHKSWNQLLD